MDSNELLFGKTVSSNVTIVDREKLTKIAIDGFGNDATPSFRELLGYLINNFGKSSSDGSKNIELIKELNIELEELRNVNIDNVDKNDALLNDNEALEISNKKMFEMNKTIIEANNGMKESIANFKLKKPEKTEIEAKIKAADILLENVSPRLKHILEDMAKDMNITINEILINRMFNVWLRNPGDYKLKRINANSLLEIDSYFNTLEKKEVINE
jgi:hypothetical protein